MLYCRHNKKAGRLYIDSKDYIRGGRGGCLPVSDGRQNKKSHQIITIFGSSYPQLVHKLSTPCEYLQTYPQVIHNRTELSTGYSQPNRGAEFSIPFRFDFASAHDLPLYIGWIWFFNLFNTIWLGNWFIPIHALTIARSELCIWSYTISYIHLIIHHSLYTKTRPC